jgi:hypothetical protein
MNISKIAQSLMENVAAPGDSKDLVKLNMKELEKSSDPAEFGDDRRKYYESLKSRAEGGEGLFDKEIIEFVETLPEDLMPKSGRSYFIKYLANAMKDDVRLSDEDVGALSSKYTALDHDPVVLSSDYKSAIKRAHSFSRFLDWFRTKDSDLWPTKHKTEYIAWLGDQFSDKFRLNDTDLEEMRDYFIGHDHNLNILSGDYSHVLREARDWHANFGKESAGMYITPPRKNTIFQVDGFIVVEISTDKCTKEEILNDCKVEGNLMGNCIGRLHSQYVVNGSEKIFSIRSPGAKQIPHVSISYENGEIGEIKAKSNKQVTNPRYVAATLKFLVSNFTSAEISKAERGWIFSVPLRELNKLNMPDHKVVKELIALKSGLSLENINSVEEFTEGNDEIPFRAHGSITVYVMAKKLEESADKPLALLNNYISSGDLRKIMANVDKVAKSGLCPYINGLEKIRELVEATQTGNLSYFDNGMVPEIAKKNFFTHRSNEFPSLPPKAQTSCIYHAHKKPDLIAIIKPYIISNQDKLDPEVKRAAIYSSMIDNEKDFDINKLDKYSLSAILSKISNRDLKGKFAYVKTSNNGKDDLASLSMKAAIRSHSNDKNVRESGLTWLKNYSTSILTDKNAKDHNVRNRLEVAIDERLALNAVLSKSSTAADNAIWDLLGPKGIVKKISRKTYLELLPDLTLNPEVNRLLKEKFEKKNKDVSAYLTTLNRYEQAFAQNNINWQDHGRIKEAIANTPWDQIPEIYKAADSWNYNITIPLLKKKNPEFLLKWMHYNNTTQYMAAAYLPLDYLPKFKNHRNPTVRATIVRRLPLDQVQDMANDPSKKVREVLRAKIDKTTPRRASISLISERIAFWQ